MVRLEDLTVGTVAGIIAAGVFVAQLILPMLVILILVGLLRNENSAATWSVVGRALHSSHWPTILRTDTASAKGVRGSVRFIALLQLLLVLLVSIASIVTPLGLYESVLAGNGAEEVPFNYAKDETTIGLGTLPRNNALGFSRWCWDFVPKVCPFSETIIEETRNATNYQGQLPLGYDDRIPKNYTEIYSAGVSKLGRTVSSIFDIQWRTYKTIPENEYGWKGNTTRIVGDYRHLSQMVLNDRWDVVDGLVVDTKTGGIGFRNHTVPTPTPYGSAWEEDILFIDPETACVDLNITLDFALQDPDEIYVDYLVLTDRGGFADMNKAMPWFDANKTWENADLKGRAKLAGWLANALTMVYLNVTNPKSERYTKAFQYLESEVNKTFPLETKGLGSFRPRHDQLMLKETYGDFLNLSTALNGSLLGGNTSYPNPFKISTANFSEIAIECSNANPRSYSNMSNIAVGCGMLLGAARRKDGTSSLFFDPGSEWTVPLYSCATAAKATIKTVSFRYNGTAGLSSLKIDDIRPKQYAKDEDKPLWAVEKSALRLNYANPVWGITIPEHANHPNITTARQEHLYLPGYVDPSDIGAPTNGAQNLPGVDFYSRIIGFIYEFDTVDVSASWGIPDYTGRSNMALYNKWQQLSRNPEDAARIINLIWTDISANAVVGTKGHLPSPPLQNLAKRDEPQSSVMVPVKLYTRRIQFKLVYGIPAFLALAVGAAIFAMALVFVCIGRAGPARLRRYLDQTSAGRIFTTFLYPNDCPPGAPKATWENLVGAKHIDVSGQVPRRVGPASGPAEVGVTGAPAGNIAYEKLDQAAISLHSLPSPQPYSPVNGGGGSAQEYFNGGGGQQYTYVPQASATLHPHGGGYTGFRSGAASPGPAA
ncbi:uncharacterized protein EI97DRAFT_459669 [Westerdykella ornata]|uniref:Uncharacterized protein n=1 Tax=Westerdykella ornata TaxID=318751 RepID=A0A6A6JFV1_WESOR|nr:uncharacterized protein EI97DRAFT_459669 [Westerdykella ornata]KAF2275033.1 hypothetical protein EI97DRAFT_459669 [Westerdykella ornata]